MMRETLRSRGRPLSRQVQAELGALAEFTARAESTARMPKATPPSPAVEHAAPVPPPVPPPAPPPVPSPMPSPLPAPVRAATPAAAPGCAALLVPVPAVVRGGDEALRGRTIERDVLLSATLPSTPIRSARDSLPVPRKATDNGDSPSKRAAASATAASATSPASVHMPYGAAHMQRRPRGHHGIGRPPSAVTGSVTGFVTDSPLSAWDDPPLSAWGEPSTLPRALPLSPPLPLSPLSPMRLPPRSALLGHPGHPVFSPVDNPPQFTVTRRHLATPSTPTVTVTRRQLAAPSSASNVSEAEVKVLVEPSSARPAGCNSAVEALRAAAAASEEEAGSEDAELDAAAALIQNAAAGDTSQAEKDAAAAMIQNAAASSLPTRFSRKALL